MNATRIDSPPHVATVSTYDFMW